ncbi:MAG: class I SAM-dependent methyltransferase [Thermoplasmata archaeon]|nr:class I SAM-dependent methyltransferase [Thermoplasmata archaeon]
MSRELSRAAARRLLRAWDVQQEAFNPTREQRFQVMFDVLAARLPSRFRVLDLGSGPGSLSRRLLDRFPRARSTAIDRDPVALQIGPMALGPIGGRLTWVDVDLGAPRWTEALGAARFDAAVSTTALHWLRPRRLQQLYRDLHRILRPGGIFLNGDFLPWPARERTLGRLAEDVRAVRFGGAPLSGEWKEWAAWWTTAERTPGLAAAFAERRRRFPTGHPHTRHVSADDHLRALRRAGFREAAVVWQDFENRIVVALR